MTNSSHISARDAAQTKTIEAFYAYLQGVLVVYRDLIPTLAHEVEYITRDDIASLDETLKEQQVLLLKTRSFESDVAGFLAKLDIAEDNLSAVIPRLPETERFRFYAFLGEFDEAMAQVHFYKEKCREILQSKLYHIDKQLAELPGVKKNPTYDANAEAVSKPLRSKTFEKTV